MISKKMTLVFPLVIALSACEPTSSGEINGWPTSDQSLSATNLVEIERNLRRLGMFGGRIDGQITEITRNSIARYQRSIGAPSTGVVSAKLVRSLRASVAQIKPAPTVKRTTTKRRAAAATPTPAPAPTVAPSTPAGPRTFGGDDNNGGDSGGGGGGGGDDGGSWG